MDSSLLSFALTSTQVAGRAHGRGPAAGAVPDSLAEPGGFARTLQAAVAPEVVSADAAVVVAVAVAAAVETPVAVGEAAPRPDAVWSGGAGVSDVLGMVAEPVEVPDAVLVPASARLLRRSLSAGLDPMAEAARAAVRGPVAAERVAVADRVTATIGAAPGVAEALGVVDVPDATAATDTTNTTDTTDRPSGSLAGATTDPRDPAASAVNSTSLMQWMLQMTPPAPVPAPAVETGRPGIGRQEGQSLLQTVLPAGLLGRSEPVAPGREVRGSQSARSGPREPALSGSTDGAVERKTVADRSAGTSRKFEIPSAAPTLPASSQAALADTTRPTAREPVQGARPAASPDPQTLLSAAVQAMTTAVAATPAVVVGRPVVAPAQAVIQTPVTQPGFSDEVVVALVRQTGQAAQGRQEVTLHLNPVEMGPVSVSIELNGSAARIEFGASEALTRHHLEAALPGLTDALQAEGLSLVHGSVHEVSRDSLAASAAGSGGSDLAGSGGAGSDARPRSDAFADGRSGFGERAPRRSTEMFSIDGRTVRTTQDPLSTAPSPGRAGRLDLFA
ncbi:flagellar hook-length control protein FliK [Sphaerotilus montanus]|uniref:Flagellar hook-length control protein-like C-terminal domain-containing protein n=1 Tax=Sphaerotilus montanus TaxID=522889 RepID=A0A7Y9R0L5_9BURK|nr:flagellar hook-length control protein FliK [Sphaerotilus montanus]NYG33399.1 hypothetical protein [Sphaerotilus montanus]NZD56967.1 flagellar hook-length control protein FliK [Sphaerotilus montanus]